MTQNAKHEKRNRKFAIISERLLNLRIRVGKFIDLLYRGINKKIRSGPVWSGTARSGPVRSRKNKCGSGSVGFALNCSGRVGFGGRGDGELRDRGNENLAPQGSNTKLPPR